ncbi:hypothetical protein A3A39_02665 [Candidatus Kaiserbacteria bacterium RIFCSPLOWO2_01_FULL_54_13]|uniref:Peptidoglycan binding-like domain-containing protein n=1 Tax=Candidatus Kaiserbacteria bacterium RIFCSPLOWO2_01_FULL_54_13 TaxID=1798512 RepID=A0A1F6F3L5_9BACT|nr:MAG: hypothetical protein A3A39_02665 [Candidatus Kaiserbacteria bacterium RIFCSPLOWO2_01_FULL_54_13]
MFMKKVSIAIASALALFPFIALATFNADLQYGSTGNDVTELQEFLTAQGNYTGPITGNFYSLTRQGVIGFQAANGISPAAGYFGPLTRAKVNAILAEQDAASDAQAIQETGTIPTPTKDDAVSLLQAQVNALLEQLKKLTAQVETQTTTQQQNVQLGTSTTTITKLLILPLVQEDPKKKKEEALKKEYGLKINALEKELLELEFFNGKESDLLEIRNKYSYTTAEEAQAALGYAPTQNQIQAAARVYAMYEATNPVARSKGTLVEALRVLQKEVRDKIAALRNELERKLLEI